MTMARPIPPSPQVAFDPCEEPTRPALRSDNRTVQSRAPGPDSEGGLRKSEARLALSSAPSQLAESTSEAALRAGAETTRLGPYQIVCELASGGMATVYLALFRSIEGFEKLCAVKRIHPHLVSERAFTTMFADEAQIAARISHPFVCSVFSYGRSQQSHYLAMEFLRGEPLSAVCRRVARAPELGDDPRFPALAARLLANFAEGLHAAHTLRDERGVSLEVVHRDVTPQNLFVLYDGTVRVTDFGIAHARRRIHQTDGQRLKGKLSYIAPEQLNGGGVDRQVDIWGLGVTFWELLVGRRLFLGANEGETLAAVVSRPVPPPSALRATVPPELDRIVLRALERDTSKRYKTARDLSRDLERFLASIGDAVPSMDVADWMAQVFPQGAERIQTLIELAARVSAATADETVVRVPSAPPPRDVTPAGSFLMVAAPRHSSVPPMDAETQPLPISSSRLSTRPTLTVRSRMERDAPSPHSSPALATREIPATMERAEREEHAPRSDPGRNDKPRLLLVDDATGDRGWSHEGGRRLRLLASGVSVVLALLGGGSLFWHARNEQGASIRRLGSGFPSWSTLPKGPVASPLRLQPVAAPVAAPSAVAPPTTVQAATTAIKPPRKQAGAAPAASPPAVADTPSPRPTRGVVMVTTPGGSGEVFESGRLLGKAPGAFQLSPGQHQLVLRSPSGRTVVLDVHIKSDAPTLVTVPDAR